MATGASIHTLAPEDRARAEFSAWARFSAARDEKEYYSSWLAILCTQIDRVNGALLLLGPDDEGAYTPGAVWPDPSRDLTHLGAAAERALAERKGIVVAADGVSAPERDQPAHIGYPIQVAGALHGAVVLDLAAGSEAVLQRSLRLVHWASAWLTDHVRRQMLERRDARLSRMGIAMDIVATAMKERPFSTSALSVANELAARLHCDRVSLGFERSGGIEVRAISHTAVFDPKMSLVRLLGDAMDEAHDQETAIVVPATADDPPGAAAHAELAREFKVAAICSAPLTSDGHGVGVIVFERTDGCFDAETVEFCKTLGALLGPILELKEENAHGVWRRMRDSLRDGAKQLVGRRHPGVKLVALVAAALLAFLSFYSTTFRVSARTVVEGAVQRAAVAPFDGHILESGVRAGDTVRSGQVLCRMEDRDLKLEHLRLVSEKEQLVRKQRQALATQDRASLGVLAAQIAQTDAQITLIDDKLSRATLKAPFDGVVVSGDLSQLLGTPVEQGKLLFQIAPLDAYRVILEIDERDITLLESGQAGKMMLSGLPGQEMPFTVRQITPVSTSQEGRNFFRVEARLSSSTDTLRPGMEGVGKVVVGERRLIWIWTHGLIDWLRIWAWKELP